MKIPIYRRLLYSVVVAAIVLIAVEGLLRVTVADDQWQLSWEKEDGLLF